MEATAPSPRLPAAPIRVLLIEDHAIFRHGLRLLLDAEPDIAVVGEAESGEAGLAFLDQAADDINVVITDLALTGISGLEVIRRAKARAAAPRCLLLTLHVGDEHVRGMVEAGADGYVLKLVAVGELVEAIRAVARGETAVSSQIARQLMAQLRGGEARGRSIEVLTARERQILALIVDGLTSKEVAASLSLSVNTVDNHRARILAKLGVSNTAAAIRLATRQGLLAPDAVA